MLQKIPNTLIEDVSDVFGCPCWRITIPDDGYEPVERCFYFADVFVDEAMRILKIERNKDIYMTNYLITCFPPPIEETFGEMINGAVATENE